MLPIARRGQTAVAQLAAMLLYWAAGGWMAAYCWPLVSRETGGPD